MRRWNYESARDHGLAGRARLESMERESDLAELAFHYAASGVIRLFLAGYEHLDVRGRHRLPSAPPFILVSNHASHLDAIALHASVPWRLRDRVYPIAAGDTFYESRATMTMASVLLNTLPLWRRRCGRHVLTALRQRLLDEPCGYIVFPEGTRSRDGRMKTFKPGVGMLVAGTDVPVFPCRVRGTHDAWPADRALPVPGHVSVRIGRPHTFRDAEDDCGGWRQVAAELEEAVRE